MTIETSAMGNDLGELDLASQEFLRCPAQALEPARDSRPVFRIEDRDLWVITRYDDVAQALGDFKTFSSEMPETPAIPAQYVDRIPPDFFPPTLIDRDPPSHTAMRKAAQKVFTQKRVAAMGPRIHELGNELIDEVFERGECNLIASFSYPLATRISMSMIGIPESDLPRFMTLADDHVAVMPYDPAVQHIPEAEWLQRWERLMDARDYFAQMVAARLEQPTDDLVSAYVHAKEADGSSVMTPDQAVSYLLLTVFAGADTTATAIANLVQLFDAHPDQLERARQSPETMADAVEEGLRRSPSSMGVNRRTTRDVEVAGTTIPAGADVFLFTISASADERRFDHPACFDVDRQNARDHLVFGRARHFCMGAPLVRLEMPIAMRLLYDRLPDLHVVPNQNPHYDPILVALVYHELQVEWEPRTSA
jgi:cytochrome P450